MPKTLLAVDDSATMRKVLEITFGGEDFRVITADGASAALSRMGDEPAAAVIDSSLGTDDGYALAKELRARSARLAVVLMASRYSPYDANRGRDAGVDDFIDKPFDTQALIEKVKKAVVAREAREVARPAAPAPAAAAPSPSFGSSHSPRAPSPVAAASPASPAAKVTSPTQTTQRTHTLSFEGGLPAVPPPVRGGTAPAGAAGAAHPPTVSAGQGAAHPAAPAAVTAPPGAYTPPASPAHTAPPSTAVSPATVTRVPGQGPPAASSVSHVTNVASVASVANGQMAAKLGELGLSPQQADAVLALSRAVVERVVWEVVPQLAEAIIKEEIARLTKDG